MDEEKKEEDVENMDSSSFEDENMAGVTPGTVIQVPLFWVEVPFLLLSGGTTNDLQLNLGAFYFFSWHVLYLNLSKSEY